MIKIPLKKIIQGIAWIVASNYIFAAQYTVLNAETQRQVITQSRSGIIRLLEQLKTYRQLSLDEQVAFLTQELADLPYLNRGGLGEGDWQPRSTTYQPGATHIVQYPVYRLDGFDCQSFVQVVMALLHSSSLSQFEKTFLKISYGAAGNPHGEIVRYYNRNNFIEGDFNPINEHNGFLEDVTTKGELANYATTITSWLTRQQWFNHQRDHLNTTITVLNKNVGDSMVQRFKTIYSNLNFPGFNAEKITLAYIPKQDFVNDATIMNTIPTPAIVEIVRDPSQWYVGNKKIRQVIGTNLTISHLGLLYRQTFQYGNVIYQKISCSHRNGRRVCTVTPMRCREKICHELMFAHATDAHPSGYFFYQLANGNYTCSASLPKKPVPYTLCNRIERLPFLDYLTGSQHGWYMSDSSYLGLHIEAVLL